MKLVQAGDTSQLALLFERHHLALFRYLLTLTRNQALSEDLVQEVFFRALKYARTFDTNLAFPVWLYGMARHAYLDQLHKRRGEVAADEVREVRSCELMPEELFSRQQDVVFLQQAMAQLSEDQREVLVLSRFHDLRYEEVGKILQCKAGAVKVRVYRALKELRERFCELRGEKSYDV